MNVNHDNDDILYLVNDGMFVLSNSVSKMEYIGTSEMPLPQTSFTLEKFLPF